MGYYRPGDSAQTQGGLPIDGLTGQFLAKKTDSDFDVEWASVPGAGGSPGAAGYPSVEVPTGFDITGSGTASVVIRFATGYSLPTSAAQQAWSTGAEQAAAATAAVAGLTPALASKADLDASGRVPAAQLPGYVDDVLEFPNFAAFPIPGETGKLYVSLASNRQYRWSGSTYIEINPSPGSTDGIPEGSVNLYFTAARGVAAAASW
ncbi:MAG: hypothetical protein FJ083_16610, partial [Cyanobacteria bacterium K_Offshore_surface_m2_239]|nr:hypothetical protein [Cyanobacteria bacterium K_Offshore_surface_m2_239]